MTSPMNDWHNRPYRLVKAIKMFVFCSKTRKTKNKRVKKRRKTATLAIPVYFQSKIEAFKNL